jgi:hypothetical protein
LLVEEKFSSQEAAQALALTLLPTCGRKDKLMAEMKTKQNDQSVEAFLNSVDNDRRRADSLTLLAMMKEVTGLEPKLWGSSIVGFGSYHYRYESGREGDMPLVGFSPRKQNLTLYIMPGFDHYDELLGQLGKHKIGKACLYINKLSDVDAETLRELISQSFEHMQATN